MRKAKNMEEKRPRGGQKGRETCRKDAASDRAAKDLQTVLRPVGVKGFVIPPKRWIVERTSSWLAR
jgi:hypothetical protein